RWELRAPAWMLRNALAGVIMVALALFILLVGPRMWRLARMRQQARRALTGRALMADATVLYTRFLEMLRARGYSKPPWFTPTEFVRSLRSPEIAGLADQFVTAYHELRFGGKAEAAPRLFLLLEELKRQG